MESRSRDGPLVGKDARVSRRVCRAGSEGVTLDLLVDERRRDAVCSQLKSGGQLADILVLGDGRVGVGEVARGGKGQDDGGGIASGVDVRNPKTLGLRAVTALAEQLNGSVRFESRGGTTVRLEFPLPSLRGTSNDPRSPAGEI